MKNIYFLSFIAMLALTTACADKDEGVAKETGELKFGISFESSGDANSAKAAVPSTAIPVTSWAKSVSQVQFFLYDAGGKVCWSAVESPSSGSNVFHYSNVPVGDYTLAAVANANSNAIVNHIGSNAVAWNEYNVLSKQISTLIVGHAAATFPAYNNPVTGPSTGLATGNAAYAVPAEIFMGYDTGINIDPAVPATATVAIKREVSLMRVRLQVNDANDGVNNNAGAGGVDFTQNASVLVYTLPETMGIGAGNESAAVDPGGVLGSSNGNAVLVGATSFKTGNPSPTDYEPVQIIDSDYIYWNDIVTFPNNGGRSNNALVDGQNDPARYYYVVISALGLSGHKLANGQLLETAATIYWSGLVRINFTPNTIREVNINLKSGGSTEIPVEPITEGDLTIYVSNPAAWDSNIQEVVITMQ